MTCPRYLPLWAHHFFRACSFSSSLGMTSSSGYSRSNLFSSSLPSPGCSCMTTSSSGTCSLGPNFANCAVNLAFFYACLMASGLSFEMAPG